MCQIDINEFRDGIFALRTRRFGDVAEIMIKAIYKLDNSNDLSFDKIDSATQQRIEVKFSTVMKANDSTINEGNVIDQCLKASVAQRAMKYCEISQFEFDCNIQQVKTDCFDIIYYGLFFADKIVIYKMSSREVKNCEGYSDKQHRNNVGEGQFHISNKNIEYHNKNFKIAEYQTLRDFQTF